MEVVTVRDEAVGDELRRRLRALLDDAFHGRFAETDWDHTCGGWRCYVLDGDEPVAHAAVVPRRIDVGDRTLRAGYVEGVATAPDRQGNGLGSAVMGAVADVLAVQYQLGVLSTGSPAFYERLGWERWRGPSFVRDAGGLVRTPDEDAGLLVLPVGSTAVDRTAPIACDCRAGDDW